MSNSNWIDEFDEPKGDKQSMVNKTNRFKGKSPVWFSNYALWAGGGLLLLLVLLIIFRGCGSQPAGQVRTLAGKVSRLEDKLIELEAAQVKQQELSKRFDRQEDFQVLVHRLDSLGKRVDDLEKTVSLIEQGTKDKASGAPARDARDTDFLREKTHTVQPGDTLYSISQKYEITVDKLRRWNELGRDGVIYPGQELVVVAPDFGE